MRAISLQASASSGFFSTIRSYSCQRALRHPRAPGGRWRCHAARHDLLTRAEEDRAGPAPDGGEEMTKTPKARRVAGEEEPDEVERELRGIRRGQVPLVLSSQKKKTASQAKDHQPDASQGGATRIRQAHGIADPQSQGKIPRAVFVREAACLTDRPPCAIKPAPPSPPMRDVPLIEPLEDRIAPAAVTISADGKTATYTDTNGDLVKITSSKADLRPVAIHFRSQPLRATDGVEPHGAANFNGSSITFSVTPPANQLNPQLSVGYIDALGVNLSSLTLPGDLGRIDVGGGASAVAIGKLFLGSLAVNGLATQGGMTTADHRSAISPARLPWSKSPATWMAPSRRAITSRTPARVISAS